MAMPIGAISSDIDTLASLYQGHGLRRADYTYAELAIGLENFSRFLEPYGIKELVKSGLVAVGRGPRSITDRSVRSLDRTG